MYYDINIMIKINYSFYNDYIEDVIFKEKLQKRINKINNDIQNNYIPTNNVLEEFFVEIFSWTVIPKSLLHDIDTIVSAYTHNYVLIDPCSGNSFHTFLFNHFCKRDVITIDIQGEEDAWIDTIECDGLSYMKNKIENYDNKVLLLSWIDYDKLTVELLRTYKGNIVISIGNYDETNSIQYLTELEDNYILIKHFIIEMPWKSIENIRIFKKNV